ncbi:hypothetical protein IFM89_023533 [Coptis chinensis]|uniref:Cytochrome P450 n=1 Tax=Coptis chinensis TaxID=261450 RepID=A0A835LJ18_9MAGN|nr:hypothetical protein IFM89_023533 [Coptis chinensis]
MEFELVGLFVALVLYVIWAMLTERRHRRREEQGQLPPGPRGLPVVGNIFQLGWAPHVSFMELARKHGPIMTVRLGIMKTIVISSNDVAREMFRNHDMVLAGRKIYEAMKGSKHGNEGSLITAQYGPHWRMLRRLCTSEFFVTSRLEAMKGVRGRCVSRMVQFVEEGGNLMFSKDLLDPKSKRGAAFFYHAGKVMDLAGKPNVADFLPMLGWLDPQGIRRKMQFHVERAFNIAGGFIKERLESELNEGGEEQKNDFLNVLLGFHGDGIEEPAMFTATTINVIIFVRFRST